MAFYKIDPFGDERGDLRSAIVAMTVANMLRGKGSHRYKIKDFMPQFRFKPRQTVQEMYQMMRAWTVAREAIRSG